MRRRDLLVATAAGFGAAIAGCGYAYGGGDVRSRTELGQSGIRSNVRYAVGDDRIVSARSGRQWVRNEEGDLDMMSATTVEVWSHDGRQQWSHTHLTATEAVTGIGPVYLLDENDRLLALERTETDGPNDSEVVERWRVELDGVTGPIQADSRRVYVVRDSSLVAIREGTVAWEIELPTAVESLVIAGETVLVATGSAIVALSPGGHERWRFETGGVPTVAAAGGRTAVRENNRVTVVQTDNGEQLWSKRIDGRGERPTVTEETVYAIVHGQVEAFDAETGEQRWETPSHAIEPPVVAASEGVYAVGNCEAVALNADDIRWSRDLDSRTCTVVDGWLDGDVVVFLLESGLLVRLQRISDDPPGLV